MTSDAHPVLEPPAERSSRWAAAAVEPQTPCEGWAAGWLLHVVDPEGPGGGPCTLRRAREFIEGAPDIDHRVCVIGGDSAWRTAQRSGLRPSMSIPCVAGRVAWSAADLWRWLRVAWARCADLAAGGRHAPTAWSATASLDVARAPTAVLAWSWRALHVARHRAFGWGLARRAGRGVPIRVAAWLALDPGQSPAARHVAWGSRRGAALAFEPVLLAGSSSVLAIVGPGLTGSAETAVVPAAPRLAPGTASPSPVCTASQDRPTLRQRWGAHDRELVVALAVDPPSRGDARLACYAAAIACVTGRRFRMLLHPQAHAAARWWRWARATGLMGAVVFEPRVAEPWTIAEGVDIALCAGEARAPHASLDRACRRAAVGVLPLMEFMAAGVPVIAEAVPPATELFVDGRSGLLVPLDDRVAVARALLRLHDDPEFRRRLGLEGQAAMRRLAEPQGFAARLREALGPLAASDQSAMKASAASR